jgi:hypothetical protein
MLWGAIMAKVAVQHRHPAILESLRHKFKDADAGTSATVGYETFSEDQKMFLLVYPYWGSKEKAAEAIGRTGKWVTTSSNRNNLFKDAVKARRSVVVDIARDFMLDLLGRSLIRLSDMLDPNYDEKTQFNAIQHIHRITGLLEKEVAPAGGNYIRTANIQINNKAKESG